MTIEKARLKDLDELYALELEIFSEKDCAFSKRVFRYHLLKDHYLIKAVIENKIAGYALVLTAKNSGWARLYAIGVHASFQGLKIGSALLGAAIDYAKKLKKDKIFLEMKASNFAAAALYKKYGFIKVKNLKSYYPLGVDGIKMELKFAREERQ